jgi:hypothetical protein
VSPSYRPAPLAATLGGPKEAAAAQPAEPAQKTGLSPRRNLGS